MNLEKLPLPVLSVALLLISSFVFFVFVYPGKAIDVGEWAGGLIGPADMVRKEARERHRASLDEIKFYQVSEKTPAKSWDITTTNDRIIQIDASSHVEIGDKQDASTMALTINIKVNGVICSQDRAIVFSRIRTDLYASASCTSQVHSGNHTIEASTQINGTDVYPFLRASLLTYPTRRID